MPTYAYKCKDCGNPLEVQQAFTDAALTECPVCGGRLRKQYGSIGVTFNGSGFYRTDSRATGTGEGAQGAAKPESGRSEGGKPDATPAKTETAKPSSAAAAAGPSAS